MRKIAQDSRLPCSATQFWATFMDEAFLRPLYLDALGFRSVTVLAKDERSRKLRVVPKLDLPGPIARLVGDAFAYEDHGTLDPAAGVWTWRMVHADGARFGDLVATSGTVRVVDEGEAACRRYEEIAIESRLFGLGRLVEAAAEKEARAAWGKELPFLTAWLRRSEQTAPRGA